MLQDQGAFARQSFAISKSDTVNQPFRRLFVGGAGTVQLVTKDGVVVPYVIATAPFYIEAEGIRVNSTDTTATDMVGEN